MNSFERYRNRLAGQPVDRIPNFNIFMQRAAHHIGAPLAQYYQDYRVLVEANLAVLNDFHVDIVQAISDPYREAADCGLEVEFPDDGLPVNHQPLIIEPEDVARMQRPEPTTSRRMSDRLAAIRSFREQVRGEVPIMGWVEGALAEVCNLHSMSLTMIDLVKRPEWMTDLLERCVEVGIAFARAQIEAGADIIGLGDAVCSQISPKMYRQFALPYEQRIFAAVRELGAVGRLHICGNTTRLLPDMARSGAHIIDVDWMVDFAAAAQACGETVAPCGNFDPVTIMLQGTPAAVREAVRTCATLGGARHFSGAGCEIPDGTSAANLLMHYQTLSELT